MYVCNHIYTIYIWTIYPLWPHILSRLIDTSEVKRALFLGQGDNTLDGNIRNIYALIPTLNGPYIPPVVVYYTEGPEQAGQAGAGRGLIPRATKATQCFNRVRFTGKEGEKGGVWGNRCGRLRRSKREGERDRHRQDSNGVCVFSH